MDDMADGMLTQNTSIEIRDKFNLIVLEHKDISAIDDLLANYMDVPDFVLPYLQAIYYKALGYIDKAVKYIDTAINKLQEENSYSAPQDIIQEFEHSVYEPFEKQLWGQAGEIYANIDKYTDALWAYKKYLLSASKIKSDDISKGLLSFRKINQHSLSDLINNELAVCSPRVMNDPFDTLLLSWGDHHLKNLQGRKHIDPYTKALEYYKIRSFSKIPNTRTSNVISNVLMWSHYANNHCGMCVEYHFSENFSKCQKGVLRFRNVIYHPKKERVSLDINTINTDIGLLTKHNAWKYENEVRLIAYLPENDDKFVSLKLDPESYIKNIFFGLRCPQKDIETVTNALSGRNVNYFQMQVNPNNIFKLSAKPIAQNNNQYLDHYARPSINIHRNQRM